jgi:hypothetical protein
MRVLLCYRDADEPLGRLKLSQTACRECCYNRTRLFKLPRELYMMRLHIDSDDIRNLLQI